MKMEKDLPKTCAIERSFHNSRVCNRPSKLLDCDFSSGSLELLSCSVCVFLGNVLFDSLRCAVNNVLSFFETETCQLTNNLDNSNLSCAGGLKDDCEFCLLFFNYCSCAASRCCY